MHPDPILENIGREIEQKGFTILKGVHDRSILEQAREDYRRYLRQYPEYAAANTDANGCHYRLTNFHTYSDAAMRIGKSPQVMKVLDLFFGARGAVYTSLTFEYSTEQPLHRDCPFFLTFPEGQFLGVWTALEDIHPDAGPLSYVPGSHRFQIDRHTIWREALRITPDPKEAVLTALGIYNTQVEAEALKVGPREYVTLKAGDTAIWHPLLVHGGSKQKDPKLTRQSIVFHCCPENTQVYAHDVFFGWEKETPPPPRYGFANSYGRQHAAFTGPNFMIGR